MATNSEWQTTAPRPSSLPTVTAFALDPQVAAFFLFTRTPTDECAPTAAPKINTDTTDDYDIHIPLSAIPLGVNLGPSLEVLSFVKDAKTGELPWIARRGWLEVGDALVSLVSLEEEYVSEVSAVQPVPVPKAAAVYMVLISVACVHERPYHPNERRAKTVVFSYPRVFFWAVSASFTTALELYVLENANKDVL